MKKKLIFSLSLLFLLFTIGAGLTMLYTYRITSDLQSIIDLHRIELVRQNFVINAHTVQSNLYAIKTAFDKELDVIVENVAALDESIHKCLGCHHNEEMTARLRDMSGRVEQYKEAISYLITTTANPVRIERLKMVAVNIGDSVLSRAHEMSIIANKSLNEKTFKAMAKINNSRIILIATLSIAFIIGVLIAITLTRQITQPVYELLKASRMIESGNLDYRTSYWDSTEFGELASSFNEMADSLKEHMNKIEESEKRYRTLFESAGDAIFILEAEGEKAGHIVAANRAAAEMHGYTVDELLSLNITDLDTPEAASQAPDRINRILQGEWIKAEINHRKKDGTVFPVEINAGLLEVGDKKYVLAIDRNITERKQAEEALQRTEQMKMVGELAAGLAHEIKNPLAGIKVSMEVLSSEAKMSDEDKEVLSKVIEEIKRIELLLRELLSFAKPPRPQFMIADIHSIIDKAMALSLKNIQSADSSKEVEVIREFSVPLPETMVDPMQLQQVFLNILFNAVEAMPNGGKLKVKTHYNKSMETIEIEISDTGKGIDSEALDKLFNPFFTTKPKGTGLGLSISKRLIEQHGGTISASNNQMGGATFMIRLPVRTK